MSQICPHGMIVGLCSHGCRYVGCHMVWLGAACLDQSCPCHRSLIDDIRDWIYRLLLGGKR